jgi:hypothetical protein
VTAKRKAPAKSSKSAAQKERLVQTSPGSSVQAGEDLGAFLGTIAKLLHETVSKFERTSSKITEIVVSQPGKTARELILLLQDFDRLQQEFSALGEALARTAESATTGRWAEGSGEDHAKHEVIGAISSADLKDRILNHLGVSPPTVPDPETLYEQNDTPDGVATTEF